MMCHGRKFERTMKGLHHITGVRLYFLPVRTRMPLKFGPETTTNVTCARVALQVVGEDGDKAEGWGETPLSVQWVWPSTLPYETRHLALQDCCRKLAESWMRFPCAAHPLETGHAFLQNVLPGITDAAATSATAIPHLAALVCNSPFDIALHDAYGKLVGRPMYKLYGADSLRTDLAQFLQPAANESVSFADKYPADFLSANPTRRLSAWHLVGGLDPLEPEDLVGNEPQDGHPVLLRQWIERDGLKCIKVKLRGNDSNWDYQRLVRVGSIGMNCRVEWLSADFNCTVQDPTYVNEILDRLRMEQPSIFARILYVEQPFPYDLERHRIDVHSVVERKPLFLDESAHDWRMIRLGRELGWNGVALKTCKTQTGAILSACWAKAHGMQLMVQDLTNPMLAQIPHVLLAAHVGTIMGVETNAMQFYPAASEPESRVHPGLYRRRGGQVDLSTISGDGFGYRLAEIHRTLPEPSLELRD
jgi:L-alanine-DL-glutamate epimerase-like enolase superfamily enzyme